jgi:uncharacterized membrane protein
VIDSSGSDLLGRGIAAVLRIGTLVAIAAVGLGYLLVLASGEEPGSPPLLALLQAGGPSALIGIGLFGLTLLPMVVLVVAAAGFRRLGERRLVLTSLVTLILLLASLVTAVALALG